MQRISQVGAMMATFGSLLTIMAQAVEEEMTNAIRDEQLQAEEQLKLVSDAANEKLDHLQSTNAGLNTQYMRSVQQLKFASDKLTELETEVMPLAGINADDVFDKLEELDLVVGQLSGTKAARDLIQKVSRDLEPSLARRKPLLPTKGKVAPSLADVAQKVGGKVEGTADDNVPVAAAEPNKQ